MIEGLLCLLVIFFKKNIQHGICDFHFFFIFFVFGLFIIW